MQTFGRSITPHQQLSQLQPRECAKFGQEMRVGFARIDVELAKVRGEIHQSKTETVRWMVGLFVAQTTVTLGVVLRLAGG